MSAASLQLRNRCELCVAFDRPSARLGLVRVRDLPGHLLARNE